MVSWIVEYFSTEAWSCSGLAWLGFLPSLFLIQVVLQPWGDALRDTSTSCAFLALTCLGFIFLTSHMALAQIPSHGEFNWTSYGLPLICISPLVADLAAVRSSSPPNANRFWALGLARRLIVAGALSCGLILEPYDDLRPSWSLGPNLDGVTQEVLLLLLFYSQGVLDHLCERAHNGRHASKDTSILNGVAYSAFVWIVAVPLLCLDPLSGAQTWGGGGPRYPVYQGSTGAYFTLHTWALLVIIVPWFQHCSFYMPFAGTEFPFLLYLIHWLPVEVVIAALSNSLGELLVSWPVGLGVALVASLSLTALVYTSIGLRIQRDAKTEEGPQ